MTDLRNQVFYRTDTEVRTGDEFYHIALTYHSELKEPPFRVEVFHGFAGNSPMTPEDQNPLSRERRLMENSTGGWPMSREAGFVPILDQCMA